MALINELNAIKRRLDALEQDKKAPMSEIEDVMTRLESAIDTVLEKRKQAEKRKK